VPRGVADPTPKRHELSKAERELLEQHAREEYQDEDASEQGDDESMENSGSEGESDLRPRQEPSADKNGSSSLSAAAIIASQKIDPKSLPPELRMDEYSDEDSADGHGEKSQLGNMLIGNSAGNVGIDLGEDGKVVLDDDDMNEENSRSEESDDEDDDDDLEDVPDTREYMPTDIQGLQDMAFAGNADFADYDAEDQDGNDDDSDVEDTNLQPDDALIVVAKTEEDFASIEVHVYEEKTGNLFVHHDIPLPSYPLCLAHGTINNEGQAGNLVAVGTFNPGIEIWNLDILDALEPVCILGGEDTSAADALWAAQLSGKKSAQKVVSKQKTMKAQPSLKSGSHTDAVMALSWNPIHRQVIASGSADKTVKLWDITKVDDSSGGIAATLKHHKDKVQSVRWHPTEGTILATGSYDRSVCIIDARSSDQSNNCKKVRLPADCEAIEWDPHQPHLLTAASEDGSVLCWDVRKFETGMTYWNFVAHEFGGCSDLSYNPNIPGMLATCAIDKTVALWDTYNVSSNPGEKPYFCGNKDMNSGKLYTVSFYPSSPWLLGCGGSGNQLALWDMSEELVFQKRFGDRLKSDNAGMELFGDTALEGKEADFEAMMEAKDKETKQVLQKAKGKNKNKKKIGKKTARKAK
jgi:periodic tryptophan protein 1